MGACLHNTVRITTTANNNDRSVGECVRCPHNNRIAFEHKSNKRKRFHGNQMIQCRYAVRVWLADEWWRKILHLIWKCWRWTELFDCMRGTHRTRSQRSGKIEWRLCWHENYMLKWTCDTWYEYVFSVVLTRIRRDDHIFRGPHHSHAYKSLWKKFLFCKWHIRIVWVWLLRRSLTFLTIGSLPSGQAHFVTFIAACVMPELIVAWPTKCGARCVVIIFRTLNTNSVQKSKKKYSKLLYIIRELKSEKNRNEQRKVFAWFMRNEKKGEEKNSARFQGWIADSQDQFRINNECQCIRAFVSGAVEHILWIQLTNRTLIRTDARILIGQRV